MKRKLFVFDLHGTLYTDDYRILDSTKDAIRKLYEYRHIISIASGHHYSKVNRVLKELGIPIVAIGNTGALIKDFKTNEVIECGHVKSIMINNMLDIFKKYPGVLYIHNKYEHRVVLNNMSKEDAQKLPVEIPDEDFVSLDYVINKIMKHNITQISIKTDPKYIPEIYSVVSKLNTTIPKHRLDNIMGIFVDCGPQNTTKWTGALKVAQMFNIDQSNIYCFGDNNNDSIMLKNCLNSVAMGNALPKIKKICKYVIGSNNEDAIASFINKEIL